MKRLGDPELISTIVEDLTQRATVPELSGSWIEGWQRARLYERAGYRCEWCGSDRDLSLDHIVPRVHHGTHDPSNLQVLCRRCNSRKGARIVCPECRSDIRSGHDYWCPESECPWCHERGEHVCPGDPLYSEWEDPAEVRFALWAGSR